MWGQTGASCEAAYSACKASLIGLGKALAKEVGPSHVRVNCLCPGVIQTDMLKEYTEADLSALRDETPLCRLGTPQDIAQAAFFLCSDDASFITGQALGVNGGFVI
jgi:3-oxoacyl-[acyl-carrier protein] reductase